MAIYYYSEAGELAIRKMNKVTGRGIDEYEGNNFRIGIFGDRGIKHPMQDRNCVLISLPKNGLEKWSFMGVFDGHCDNSMDVSSYLAEELLNNILEADQELFDELAQSSIKNLNPETINERIKLAIRKAFFEIDSKEGKMVKKLTSEYGPIKDHFIKTQELMGFPGSTAVACLISPTHFYLINCGDSRAILVSDNQIKIATLDHKPNNPLETERIKNAGGDVWTEGNRIIFRGIKDFLNVSRSFGDYSYKCNLEKQPFEQAISAEPDICIHERSNKDEFIVLACDGIWNVINNKEIQQYINYRLKMTQNLAEICEDIVNTCVDKVFIKFSN
jgi:serine/threonine protein phosphatase PrpC